MKTKSKLTVGITLIFLTGTLVGVMGTRVVFRHMLAEALERPSILSDSVEKTLDSLSLDPDEHDTIMRALSESLAERQALKEEFRSRFLNIATETRRKIESELTPEQRRQFRREVRDELPLLGRVIERLETDAQ
jgi:ribosomal protein L16 Arg81 hydroxylase